MGAKDDFHTQKPTPNTQMVDISEKGTQMLQ
jgi:hypothetical protein